MGASRQCINDGTRSVQGAATNLFLMQRDARTVSRGSEIFSNWNKQSCDLNVMEHIWDEML